MSLAHLQADLDAHKAKRPVQPCPVSEMTPKQYADWSHALALWAIRRDTLQGLVDGFGGSRPLDRQPHCNDRTNEWTHHISPPPRASRRRVA